MQALTYTGNGALEQRDLEPPTLSGDGEALVRPVAVATCDLDAAIVAGQTAFPPPIALGHECVAEVVETGDDVGSVEPGTLVVVPFQVSCGECESCRRGRTANCRTVPSFSMYGFGATGSDWGGFLSDVVRVPYADHMLVPLPAGLDPVAVASASDNIADGWRTVGPPLERDPGAAVLVVGGAGPGSIGLYAAAIAIALGSERVVYVDADEGRRSIAAKLGAEAVDRDGERPGRFPVTVDASADPEGLALALGCTERDGICTSTGIYFGEPPPLPLLEMYMKNTTFVTGRVHARPAIPHVLELAAHGRMQPQEVTTRVVPWADAPAALAERDWVKLVFSRD
jgi:threonine dehydrogenase-like Zn-dependent dehydrogenase